MQHRYRSCEVCAVFKVKPRKLTKERSTGNRRTYLVHCAAVSFASRVPQDPVLQLWDDFSGHWSASVREYAASIDVVLMKVPAHATSVSQPADVVWSFPMKARLRRHWHENYGWIKASWDDITTRYNCEWLQGQQFTPYSDLISGLDNLSLLEGDPVDEEQGSSYRSSRVIHTNLFYGRYISLE
ncbi:hypothetical protein P3T76_002007 [Phytophthora citrophthora]|uniref:DDE-1 domain-containing protein n=1 Tax=Phytophthora citrophthora TaxID=4793 RepID=A0AAD9GWL8_9STRA|nr:hypothetical protein P3T76_002007 [Phytophthora citrophthora]